MDTFNYTYKGKRWIQKLTISDNDSFFHSISGIKTNENKYFDRHAKYHRMRWAAFLTYFENEVMSPSLSQVLTNCLSANPKYKGASIKDKSVLIKYMSDIVDAEQPVIMEEIPILSTLENITIIVLSDRKSAPVTVFKPNPEILGSCPHSFNKHREVVLSLEGHIYSKLSPIDRTSSSKIDKNNNATKENKEQKNCRSGKFVRGGNAGTKGVEFQVNLLTIFLLNAILHLKNWKLSTENKEAGKFDDVVLELSDNSIILLQAKYKQSKKITHDQLLTTNTRNDDFSLPKYFFSYQKIKTKFHIEAIVICTNTNVEKKALKLLNGQIVGPESILHYEDDSCSFFTFNDAILGDLKENLRVYHENNSQGGELDEGVISDENIRDFLSKLQIFCNYPQGYNIRTVMEKILFRIRNLDNLWHKISLQDVLNKVMAWFKDTKGEYLTADRAKFMLCEIKSDKYCEILEHYHVQFEHNDINFRESKRLLHVISKDGYLMQAIKIHHNFKHSKSRVLFINPEDNYDVKKQVINAFELPCYEFLVLICLKVEAALINEIFDRLRDILDRYKYKKLILVSESEYNMAQRVGLSDNSCIISKDSVTFGNLNEDSQKRLLKKKIVRFQGHSISLEQLLPDETIKACHKAICPKILEKLVRGNIIKVGTEVQALEDNTSRYYVAREFKRPIKTRDETFTVETIYECNEKLIIISDNAGMGKSTVLAKLATTIKDTHPHLWVIRIDLNDCTGTLKKLRRNNRKTIDVTDLLDYSDSTKLSNQCEEFIFTTKGRVTLLLDGVDEISPDYSELIVSLISECQKAHNIAKIFVTTRPHMTKQLETKFQAKSFVLKPFSKQNQIDYLTNYWMLNLNLDEDERIKCQQYAEALINKMSSWVKLYQHRENHFAAIPLQVRMLAEIFQQNSDLEGHIEWEGCEEFLISLQSEPKLPAKMNITKLYQIFIQKKCDEFIDRGNPNGNITANQALMSQFNECLVCHRTLALRYILDDEYKFFSSYRECGKNVVLKTLKIGIVQKLENKYYFVHRTFGEFFVAESLVLELKLRNRNALFQKFLIREVLSYPEYNVVRRFFNNCLGTVLDSLPSESLQSYGPLIYEVNMYRLEGYYLFHQMAAESCASILQFLFKCVGSFTQGKSVNIQDDNGKTPLHYASRNGHLETVELLIRTGAKVNISDFENSVPLREAVKGNHFDVAKFLIEQGADILATDRLGHNILYVAIMGDNVGIASLIVNTVLEKNEDNFENEMIPYATAYLGQLDTLMALIQQGVDVNTRIGNGESLIFGATRGRQPSTIRYLVGEGAEVNTRDEEGNTPLCLAVLKGYLETIECLVECGVEIDEANNEGRTALHTAASWGRLDIVEFLVNSGASIDIRDSDGYAMLHLAAEEGLLDTIRFLLEKGADVDIKDYDERTALFSAALQGETDTIKFLIEQGADITCRDKDGSTALFLAAEYGELDTIRCFVECGADVNVQDNDGCTMLHLAVLAFRYLNTVEFLVECGADLEVKDNNGRTALLTASEHGNLEAVRFLVEAGAELNACDTVGFTSLHLATARRHFEIIRFLIERGAELNAKSRDGWTPFHLATLWGNLDSIKLLMGYGADINIKCKDERPALFLAVEKGHLEVIKFFVAKVGVRIDIEDWYGRTALHGAASSGNVDVVKLLIEYGADVRIKDWNDNTAADLAKELGHLHLLDYLEADEMSIFTLCLRCFR